MTRSKKFHTAATLAAIAIVVAAAFAASPVLAAKGGNAAGGGKHGHGGGGTPTATVTITVSPNPVPAYSSFTMTFSGLIAGHAYNVYSGGAVYWLSSDTGSATWYFQGWDPGTYTFTAYDITSGTAVWVGSLTFQVV